MLKINKVSLYVAKSKHMKFPSAKKNIHTLKIENVNIEVVIFNVKYYLYGFLL